MRITSRGQVTIPIEIRERLGLVPNTEVEFVLHGAEVRIRKARRREATSLRESLGEGLGESRARRLVQRMAGKANSGLSTDEIIALTRGPG